MTVIPSGARNLALPQALQGVVAQQQGEILRCPLLKITSGLVIPAQAGIHRTWVPACAGTTMIGLETTTPLIPSPQPLAPFFCRDNSL